MTCFFSTGTSRVVFEQLRAMSTSAMSISTSAIPVTTRLRDQSKPPDDIARPGSLSVGGTGGCDMTGPRLQHEREHEREDDARDDPRSEFDLRVAELSRRLRSAAAAFEHGPRRRIASRA